MLKSYFIIASRFPVFMRLVMRHGISLHPKYSLRFPFLFQSSLWSSLLALREKVMYGKKIREATVPKDPVFIVGHWRTGSTLLHQLFSCDPQLIVPTLLQCTYPDSFLSSQKFIAPVMKKFLPEKRPMDNVLLGPDDPQEDEYALLRLSTFSPLERLIFPRTSDYFILGDKNFLPPEPGLSKWKEAFNLFAKKLHLDSPGNRIVFKNPFHSMRIPVLRELFPNARFIHTFRDPRRVVPSTIHMWTVVGRENTLRKEWRPPSLEDAITGFDRIANRVKEELAKVPEERQIDVRFEEMEKDPMAMVQKIYSHFGFEFSAECKYRLDDFLKKTAGYKKNRYSQSEEEKGIISERLKSHMEGFGYQ